MVAAERGKVSGGHVLPGYVVLTTAELAIGATSGFCFTGKYETLTGAD